MEITCKQFINIKWEEFKSKYYYKKLLELRKTNKEMAIILENQYKEKFKKQWRAAVVEYGRSNKLNNTVIYSFISEFSYDQLLYEFRNGRALEGWKPSKKYTLNHY